MATAQTGCELKVGQDVKPRRFHLPLPRGEGAPTIHRVALGLFLLATAALKLQGGMAETVWSSTTWLSSRVQLMGVEAEILLGLWLLTGWAARAARWAAASFFATLAGISLHLVWIGQSTCGCFGRIPVSPWLSFVLDGALLVSLLAVRPPRNESLPAGAGRRLLRVLLGTGLALAVVAGSFALAVTNPVDALYRQITRCEIGCS